MMKVVKSKRLANYLLDNDIPMKRIKKDSMNNDFLVFIFEYDEELNSLLKIWDEKDKYIYRM